MMRKPAEAFFPGLRSIGKFALAGMIVCKEETS